MLKDISKDLQVRSNSLTQIFLSVIKFGFVRTFYLNINRILNLKGGKIHIK